MTKETPENIHTFKFYIYLLKKIDMSKKMDFFTKASEVHGKKYDYSLVDYKSNGVKIKIICPEHGEFEQRPNDHISKKCGCPKCSGKEVNTIEFIDKLKKIHGDKYDYSKVKYRGHDYKIIIICKDHGEFEQLAYSHLVGVNCPACSAEEKSIKSRKSLQKFIEEATAVHKGKFDYSKVEYVNTNTKVKIICPIHGEFEQMPYSHLQGKGCKVCRESKGEKTIRNFLEENKISFIPQYTFSDCKNERELPFDFYLPILNTCIEYDGKQHFGNEHGWFGANKENAIKDFERLKMNDSIKNVFCKKSNIKLIRISSKEDILSILRGSLTIEESNDGYKTAIIK